MSHPPQVTRYQVGDMIRLSATIVASGGALTSPSYLEFRLYGPSGPAASYIAYGGGGSVANPAAGVFYRDITAQRPAGTWMYGVVATGLVQAAEEWVFIVDPSTLL